MTPEEALAIYHAGPEAVVKVLLAFSAELEFLREQVETLQIQVKTLQDQIAKNSRNSSNLLLLMDSINLLPAACGNGANVNPVDNSAIQGRR